MAGLLNKVTRMSMRMTEHRSLSWRATDQTALFGGLLEDTTLSSWKTHPLRSLLGTGYRNMSFK